MIEDDGEFEAHLSSLSDRKLLEMIARDQRYQRMALGDAVNQINRIDNHVRKGHDQHGMRLKALELRVFDTEPSPPPQDEHPGSNGAS